MTDSASLVTRVQGEGPTRTEGEFRSRALVERAPAAEAQPETRAAPGMIGGRRSEGV